MKIVHISDVHGKWSKLSIPECDLLISSGDYSFRGETHMVRDFHAWLNKQKAKHIISVQGNHEVWVEQNFEEAKAIALAECPRVHFIDEGTIEIEGVKIFCSAVTPWFHNWAWNRYRGSEIKQHWDKIEEGTDIVITHGPAYDILDKTARGDLTGCEDLLAKMRSIKTIKLHFFGHIHEAYGSRVVEGITHINSSICNENYNPWNKPQIIGFNK